MYNEYINGEGRIIRATEYAYEAIYKAQGYKPRGDEIVMFTFEEATPSANVGSVGGGAGNNAAGNGTTATKRKGKPK